jgi:hypothetical protein
MADLRRRQAEEIEGKKAKRKEAEEKQVEKKQPKGQGLRHV